MRNPRFTPLLILCFTLHGYLIPAPPPVIRSVHITGNTAFGQDDLTGRMSLRVGAGFSPGRLSRDSTMLILLYQSAGYYFARIAPAVSVSPDSTKVDVSIGIDEGRQLYVDTLVLNGCHAFSGEEALGAFSTKPKSVFMTDRLEQDIKRLVLKYENAGYPFASIEVGNIAVDSAAEGGVSVILNVEEGKEVTIDEIRIRGNTQTRPDVIVRETRIRPHEVFNEDKVEKIPALLRATNLFSSVQEPQVFIDSAGGGLLITLTEQNTNTFDGIVGYSPASDISGGGAVSGYAHVTMGNLFGTARRLDVLWLRDGRGAQEINLAYREPWLFGFPLSASGVFHERQQDSTYVQRTVEGHLDLAALASLSIGGFITHTVVIPSTTIVSQPVQSSRNLSFGLNLQYDNRDDILSPMSGALYRTVYQIGTKKIFSYIPPNQTTSVQSVMIDAEMYKSVAGNQVAALGVHGRQIIGSQLQTTDYFRFGGATTLRGYNENQFAGTRVAWTNAEYRFLLERHSYFFPLFDMGFVYLPGDAATGSSSTQLFRYGYGIGVRLDSPLGNIGVTIAFGKGDSFRQGKLHVSLMNSF